MEWLLSKNAVEPTFNIIRGSAKALKLAAERQAEDFLGRHSLGLERLPSKGRQYDYKVRHLVFTLLSCDSPEAGEVHAMTTTSLFLLQQSCLRPNMRGSTH